MSSLTFTNTTFDINEAHINGGAIFNNYPAALTTITNSTIAGDLAIFSGGVLPVINSASRARS